MSQRFRRFAEQWIEEHIRPSTMDSFEQGADAWIAQCFAEGAKGGFVPAEMEQEKAHLVAKVAKALAAEHVPDLDKFRGGDF